MELPSAPTSPEPSTPQLEGSVHWGVIGDHSGVQTPAPSPQINLDSEVRHVSVIQSAPPALPPRTQSGPPPLPPRFPRDPLVTAPGLTPAQYINPADHLSTPLSSRPTSGVGRLSSTDPFLLDNWKIPLVSTSVSSLDSGSEVFPSETQEVEQLQDNMDNNTFKEEAKQLLRVRRRLVRMMNEFTEADINTSRITVMERDLDRIREMKDDYQDGVDDFIDKYRGNTDDDSVLERWSEDITLIGDKVKIHADKIRYRAAVVHRFTPTSHELLLRFSS